MARAPLSPYRALLRAGMRWAWERLRKLRVMLHELRQRLPVPVKRAIRRISRITAGTMAWIVAGIAGLFIVAHFWLPTITEKKGEIESYLTGAVGNPVELGGLQTFWDGLNPGLRVQDLRILTTVGEPALRLREAQLSLSWRALLLGSVEINSLTLIGPQLTVERSPDGGLRITGLAATPTASTTLPDFSNWLFRQRSMVIMDGEIEWLDRAAPDAAHAPERMTIRAVLASLRNEGSYHSFALRAVFPPGVCAKCRIEGEITGNPLQDTDWEGEIRVRGQEIDLQQLPMAVRQRLPAGLTGKIDLDLAGRWREARLEEIDGRLGAQDFSVPFGPRGDNLALRVVETGIHWRHEPGSWQLRLESLRLAHAGQAWLAGQLNIEARKNEGELTVEHVNLADAAGFLSGWSQAGALHPWLREAEPGGWLHQVRLSWTGPPHAPDSYRFETHASNLQAKPSGKVPGVSSLSGNFRLSPQEGEFRIDSHSGQLDLPQVMHESIPFARLASRVRWWRDEGDWRVQAGDIEFRNADARVGGDIELRVPADRSQSPAIKLNMTLHEGRGENAARYFPRVMPEGLNAYLRQAIQGGRVTQASVAMEGALGNFPFRDGQGRFEVRAEIKNGRLEFLRGWTPLRNLDVDMRFTGTGMLLTAGAGNLRGLNVSRMVVEIEDFRAPEGAVLTVQGHASGLVADAVAVLKDSKHPRFRPWLLPGLGVSGQGVLDLDLRVPLRTATSMTLDGEYRVAGGRLAHETLSQQSVEGVRGMLGFNEGGLRRGRLEGRWLGNPLEFQAAPAGRGTEVSLRGEMAPPVLNGLLGPALGRQIHGPVPWQFQWQSSDERQRLALEADLQKVSINLPAPLEKPAGDALTLQARSSGLEGNTLVIELEAGNRATGILAVQRRDGRWVLQRGRIAVGERVAALPAPDGLHVSARLPAINVDRWWPVLQPVLQPSTGADDFAAINRVSLDIATLDFLERSFGRLNLDMTRGPGQWTGRLDGEAVAGQGILTLAGAPADNARAGLQLSLERLAVPASSPGAKGGSFDPRKLPALQVKSKSFRYAEYDLGSLDFSAEPSFAGWRITSLGLKRPETELRGRGMWAINYQGKQSSRFDLLLSSSNFGETLGEFGFSDELVGGKLNMQSSWNWPGGPGDFAFATLNGEAAIELKSGQLPRISPGAGRLFGAFDLRSVTRLLTLDFSTLVAKGLAFDNLQGKLEVDNGNAYTRNLAIQVPGADIELRGRIGLAARDLDMTMDVTPRVSTNLAPVIGGTILGGPVVGGAIAVLGGMTRKPFEQTTRTEYTVKGSWDDPKAELVHKPVTAGEEAQP